MEVKAVRIGRQEAEKLFPARYHSLLESENVFTFVACENDAVVGASIFQVLPKGRGEIVLKYFGAKDDNEEIIIQMLLSAEQILAECGGRLLVSRENGDDEYLLKHYEILKNAGFLLTQSEGHFLGYYVQDLLDTAFFDKIEKIEPYFKNICSYYELDRTSKAAFASIVKKHGLTFDERKEGGCSKFYLDNNNILGYINISMINDKVMYIAETYREERNGDAVLIPLLAQVLNDLTDLHEDAMLFYKCYSDGDYDGIKKVFGEAETDERLFEYMKKIQ